LNLWKQQQIMKIIQEKTLILNLTEGEYFEEENEVCENKSLIIIDCFVGVDAQENDNNRNHIKLQVYLI